MVETDVNLPVTRNQEKQLELQPQESNYPFTQFYPHDCLILYKFSKFFSTQLKQDSEA